MFKIGGVPTKRLAELQGRLVENGVVFRCPCCRDPIYLPFANAIPTEPERKPPRFRSLGGGFVSFWQRTGTTVETLTLWPGIFRRSSCGWHGYVTNGEVRTVLTMHRAP